MYEWTYTAEADRGADVTHGGTVVDVCRDARGCYWVGLTHYVQPNDWTFEPRYAWDRLRDAEWDADRWAREIAADARIMAR